MSKGSKRRPGDQDKFRQGWDRVFGKDHAKRKDRRISSPLKVDHTYDGPLLPWVKPVTEKDKRGKP